MKKPLSRLSLRFVSLFELKQNRKKFWLKKWLFRRQGKHVVVDRQNFNVSQRRVWLDLARAASPNITVTALVFSLSDEAC